ncbi:MAG TPA: DUF3307 domain-containing protein [Acidimicrobiales bacterium]|nr:DUF3307 domain-containing protein [Acidimicrobiales bacterium]
MPSPSPSSDNDRGGRQSAFPAVLAGHLIGDWVIQTDWQAANKERSWKANQQHMVGYHVALAACAALVMPARRVAVLTAISWATHSIIDRRWPVRRLLAASGSEAFSGTTLGLLTADQALHLAILALTTTVLERRR